MSIHKLIYKQIYVYSPEPHDEKKKALILDKYFSI